MKLCRRIVLLSGWVFAWLFAAGLPEPVAGGQDFTWRESKWQDFVDGEVDPAMYVSRRTELEPDSGCVEFMTYFDINHDDYYDLIAADHVGPYVRIYLGSSTGFSAGRLLRYSTRDAAAAMFGDLDGDRNPELIHSGQMSGKTEIYWGTPTGPSATDTTILAAHGNSEAVYVADFDHDAWLDVIVGCWDGSGRVRVYWGGPSGWSTANRSEILVGFNVCANIEVADFNHDGFSDAALARDGSDAVIYFGPNRTWDVVDLPFTSRNAHGLSVADLDGNGWVDIVMTAYAGYDQSYIYFGGPSGFSTARRTIVDVNNAYGGSAVGDLNQDGRLDIIYFLGYGMSARPKVFYNTGAEPWFDDAHSGSVGPFSVNANGGIIADFNFDSIPDLQVCAEGEASYVWYGPNYNRVDTLPVEGDHHGSFREPGNVYDRSLSAWYLSSIYDAGLNNRVQAATTQWTAREPVGSSVSIAFRSGPTPQPDSAWTGFVTVPLNGGSIPDSALGHRYVQYRARFGWRRPNALPELEAITTNLSITSSQIYDVGVDYIIAPRDTVPLGRSVVPVAVVRNWGNRAASFPVRIRIGTAYRDSLTLSLQPGAVDTARFAAWVAAPAGRSTVTCSTGLAGDSNPENDRETTSVLVLRRDVGAVQIAAPRGRIGDGQPVRPRALVQNFGSVRQDFPVIFRIGAGYADTVDIHGLLPDSVALVTFRLWTASTGRYRVACSTAMTDDADPWNDLAVDSVYVGANVNLDVGVEAILAPAGAVDSGSSVVPQALIANYGLQSATFPVCIRIAGDYADTQQSTLAPGMQDTVRFRAWTAGPRGVWPVVCTTALDGDSNPPNNVLASSVTVDVPDVGAVAILEPVGRIPSEDSVWPRARVRNFGTATRSFAVQFRIGGAYSDEAAVAGLPPDSTQEVTFAGWYAVAGDYAVSCSTRLAGDALPANDRVTDSVEVTMRSLLIKPDTAGLVYPAQFTDYRLRVWNRGTHVDTVDLQSSGTRANWTLALLDSAGASPLGDHNGNGRPDLGELAPGATGWLTVRVGAPADELAGREDTSFVIGRSARDTSVTDDARLCTAVRIQANVMIAPDRRDSLAAGASLDYDFTVLNLGNARDTVDIDLERVSVDTGWSHELRDAFGLPLPDLNHNGYSDVGPLDPLNGATTLRLHVTAPVYARRGVVDTVRLWAQSGNVPSVRRSVLVLSEVLGVLTRLVVTPDHNDNILEGETRTYPLFVQTEGNMNAAVGLRAWAANPDWTVEILDAAQSQPISGFSSLLPGTPQAFSVRIKCPDQIPDDLSGALESLSCCRVLVAGWCLEPAGLTDTATLNMCAVPGLAFHNFENPFHDRTQFVFSLPRAGSVTLRIYNRAGELVRSVIGREDFVPGVYSRPWDGTNGGGRKLGPGTYLAVLELTDADAGRPERMTTKVLIR